MRLTLALTFIAASKIANKTGGTGVETPQARAAAANGGKRLNIRVRGRVLKGCSEEILNLSSTAQFTRAAPGSAGGLGHGLIIFATKPPAEPGAAWSIQWPEAPF
jgi:hypothetical protein